MKPKLAFFSLACCEGCQLQVLSLEDELLAILEAKTAGIAEDKIVVSLERRMKCGVGKCGHCQINGLYCCQDGPVFTYDQVSPIPEAF